jgi:hypothetical protein
MIRKSTFPAFLQQSITIMVLINWNLPTKIEGKLDSIVPLLKAMI